MAVREKSVPYQFFGLELTNKIRISFWIGRNMKLDYKNLFGIEKSIWKKV